MQGPETRVIDHNRKFACHKTLDMSSTDLYVVGEDTIASHRRVKPQIMVLNIGGGLIYIYVLKDLDRRFR